MERETDFYTIQELEVTTGHDRKLLYKACANGQIPSVRLGKRVLVPKTAWARYLAGDWTPRTDNATA